MTRAVKHRHAVDTGYARGEETRARIVVAALKMFGERGFEGASTRDIATVAGVNAPALQYYFDNKEGVYLACVEYIMGRVWGHMAEVVEHAETILKRQQANDEDLIAAFCAVQTHMAQFMFTAKDAADWRLFMARLQAGEGPPAAFHVVHEGMKKRMANATSTIVGRLLGRPADDEETVIRTMALMGPLTVFQCAPRSFMARLNWDVIDAERLTLFTRVIREQTATLLRSMVAARLAAKPRGAVRSNTRLVRR